jgi:hypothetical protein
MAPDYYVYIGIAGLILGILSIFLLLYRRLRWLLNIMRRKKTGSPRILAGIRNLILLLLWISVFSVVMFAGFFLQAYHSFTLEKPVARITIEPTEGDHSSRITLVRTVTPDSQVTGQYLIRGDQWVLEGDILKWDNWMNFLGLDTRYRLTRIRGRYLNTEDEINRQPTIYSLVRNEDDPVWRYLYKYGPRLPFVNSVYGNAVFQTSGKSIQYEVLVSTSGFLAREINPN